MRLTPQEADWLYALQRPWPLVERPLAALAADLGSTEDALLRFIAGLRAQGLVRRVGAVFDARRLGYRSCLFALPALQPQNFSAPPCRATSPPLAPRHNPASPPAPLVQPPHSVCLLFIPPHPLSRKKFLQNKISALYYTS